MSYNAAPCSTSAVPFNTYCFKPVTSNVLNVGGEEYTLKVIITTGKAMIASGLTVPSVYDLHPRNIIEPFK